MVKIDWKNPNYTEILYERAQRLNSIREAEQGVDDFRPWPKLKAYYKENPWQLITDWGMTFDPRKLEVGEQATIPFILFDKQVEFLKWVHERWKSGERAICEKSRECGVTWLSVGYGVAMWLTYDGFVVNYSSNKEDTVDQIGNPKSIFEKIRFFIDYLPEELKPNNWDRTKCCSHMKVVNPENGSALVGEAGKNIGRGGRSSIAFVDEAAHLEHPRAVEAALSQNTNCQIDISSVCGSGNLFYEKKQRWDGTRRVFIFDWKDDPRKDQAWYDKQCENLDEQTVAQEIDRDYHASETDSFIEAKWVVAAIDAHKKLGFDAEGLRVTGFDPADTGDNKAIVNRYGSVVVQAKELVKGDITQAIPWAFRKADNFRADVLIYDGDGMGDPSMKVALQNKVAGRMKVTAYHGSAKVKNPNKIDGKSSGRNYNKRYDYHKVDEGRLNKDAYYNYRAQTWAAVARRFKATYDAINRANQGMIVNADPDELISIDSNCDDLIQLQAELSRPKRVPSGSGKIKVESKVDMKRRQVRSPNLADSLVMAFSAVSPKAGKENRRSLSYRHHGISDASIGY